MGSVGDDFRREREALRATLVLVGPDAPTACGSWTATDLAVHVVGGEIAWAVPNAPFRWLVGRGVRVDRLAPFNNRALIRERRRHGFEWALAQLGRDAPRLHGYGTVGAVSLLEMWAHHEDLVATNDLACASGVSLDPVLSVLTRYQRRWLSAYGVRVVSADRVWFAPQVTEVAVTGADADLARWLSGRAGLDSLSVIGSADAVGRMSEATLVI